MSKTLRNSLHALLLAVLLGAALCARSQDEPALGGFKLAEFPDAGAAPIFKLLDAGAAPRREFRYRLKAGATHKLVMTMRMSIGVELDGRSAPVTRAPAVRMLFEYRVIEADAEQARIDFAVTEPPELLETEGVAAAVLDNMRKTTAQMASIRGKVTITPRGVIRDTSIEIGQQADPNIAQMMDSMHQSMKQASVAMPEGAVGVGAEWKVLQRIQSGGVAIYQVASFKVTRIEGSVVTMAVAVDQLAPRQDLPPPPGAQGARAELVSMSGNGEGHTAVDLTSPVPRSSMAIDSTLRMNIQAPDRTLQMGMRNRMQVQIEPATP